MDRPDDYDLYIEKGMESEEARYYEEMEHYREMEDINKARHYNKGKYETIEIIEDWELNFNLGNAIKYIARCNHKENKNQDLEKAIYYIKREIKHGQPN